ncbi:UbiA family prenyltransferase [Streptomyces sp. DSM 44915]|uniref:UbiA family prenyltransferase n=1 Tax=Streptomyces chisholmiae TaxID=3075540 RepID=A0ABU2JLF7_9ACTN|nr:UbiA family prenyltransferase [Streptomyces sp. DSM 44915]MDT0265817.1 UbiA family prenyltransferase [Streptomyces sp. DSM 44915]
MPTRSSSPPHPAAGARLSATAGDPGPLRPGPVTLLAWTNVLFGATGAACAWVTSTALGHPGDPVLAAFAFFLVAAVYTRDRLQSAGDGTSRRSAWTARHARSLRGWTAACVLVLPPLAVLRPWCAVALATAGTLGWCYATPLVPWRGPRRAPRDLPGLKLPYVVAVWAVVTVLLPAAQHGRLQDSRTWCLALSLALIMSVTALLNDVRDVDDDRHQGAMTLPVLLGERGTRVTAYALAAGGVGVGQLVLPLPTLVWALYNVTLLARYRPRPGVHPRPWVDVQGLVPLTAVLLTG